MKKHPKWKQEIPMDVLPMLEEIDFNALTLTDVIEACEQLIEVTGGSVEGNWFEDDSEGFEEILRYIRKFERYAKKPITEKIKAATY
ncbi:MAG: hypothetical protein ACI35O_17090 [Bacillaceae bacterium]